MRIFHIATDPDWRAALQSGSYTTSTRGRTLAEEGFIHAARQEQVEGVFDRYYRDAPEHLVLLTIDTDRLDVPWSEDPVGEDTFPHLHGPLNTKAVVHVQPLGRNGEAETVGSLYLKGLYASLGAGMLLIALLWVGVLVGGLGGSDVGRLLGAGVGLVLGVMALLLIRRRR